MIRTLIYMLHIIDFEMVLDWNSIKLNGITVALCALSGSQVLFVLGGIATVSTIAYNAIRIYKELKGQKNKSTP